MKNNDGWSWIIVLASFLICLLGDGVRYSYGLLYIEFLEEFQRSKAETSWIGSIMFGTYGFAGPFASIVIDKLGCRVAAISGCVMTFLAFIISMFGTSVQYLYISLGLLGGVGNVFMMLPANVVIVQTFHKRRSLAMGVAMCGSGVGAIVFNPLTKFLIDEYRWRGALLIEGAVILNGCVFAALMRQRLPTILKQKDVNMNSSDTELEAILTNINSALVNHHHKSESQEQNRYQNDYTSPRFAFNDSNNAKKTSKLLSTSTSHDSPNTVNTDQEHTDNIVHHSTAITISVDQEHRVNHSTTNTDNSDVEQREHVQPCNTTTAKADQEQREKLAVHNITVNTNTDQEHMEQLNISSTDITDNSDRVQIITTTDESDEEHTDNVVHPCNEITDKDNGEQCEHHSTTGNDNTNDANSKLDTLVGILKRIYRFELLKNRGILICMLSIVFLGLSYMVPFMFLPDMMESVGYTRQDATWMLTAIGISNVVMRVPTGVLGDKQWVSRFSLFVTSRMVTGVLIAVMVVARHYVILLLVCIAFGLALGLSMVLVPLILADIFGDDLVADAYGLILLAGGISSLTGPPLAGWLVDATGTYLAAFIVAGTEYFIGGALMLLVPHSR